MSVVRRVRYFGVFVGVFAIILGLLGGISTPAYLILAPVGFIVVGIGLVALLGFVALAVFFLIIGARQ
jgi:hypothetical protein